MICKCFTTMTLYTYLEKENVNKDTLHDYTISEKNT